MDNGLKSLLKKLATVTKTLAVLDCDTLFQTSSFLFLELFWTLNSLLCICAVRSGTACITTSATNSSDKNWRHIFSATGSMALHNFFWHVEITKCCRNTPCYGSNTKALRLRSALKMSSLLMVVWYGGGGVSIIFTSESKIYSSCHLTRKNPCRMWPIMFRGTLNLTRLQLPHVNSVVLVTDFAFIFDYY